MSLIVTVLLRRRVSRTLVLGAAFVVVLGLAVAGCGSSSSSSTSSGGAASGSSQSTPGASSTTAASNVVAGNPPSIKEGSACGLVPTSPPTDPSGFLSSAPANVQAGYNGFENPLVTSAWTNFKPKHGPPWNIGVFYDDVANDFNTTFLADLKTDLTADGKAKVNVTLYDTAAQDVSDLRSGVQQGVDLIIDSPLSAQAAGPVIQQAGAAGIPVVTQLSPVPGKYAVNVSFNTWLAGAQTSAYLANNLLHGKGNVLMVHGLPGVPLDVSEFAGAQAAFKQCPGIKIAGTITGGFSLPIAKTATLQFLATHPGQIDGVFQAGPQMSPGIIQAFQQTGRKVPPVIEIGALNGPLTYWKDNLSKGYDTVGIGLSPSASASATARVALGILEGKGPKVASFVASPSLILRSNLDQWATVPAPLTAPGSADGPPDNYLPDDYLSALWTNP